MFHRVHVCVCSHQWSSRHRTVRFPCTHTVCPSCLTPNRPRSNPSSASNSQTLAHWLLLTTGSRIVTNCRRIICRSCPSLYWLDKKEYSEPAKLATTLLPPIHPQWPAEEPQAGNFIFVFRIERNNCWIDLIVLVNNVSISHKDGTEAWPFKFAVFICSLLTLLFAMYVSIVYVDIYSCYSRDCDIYVYGILFYAVLMTNCRLTRLVLCMSWKFSAYNHHYYENALR